MVAEFEQFDFGRLILGLVKHGVLLSISITVVVADSRGQNQQVLSFLLLKYSKYAVCLAFCTCGYLSVYGYTSVYGYCLCVNTFLLMLFQKGLKQTSE